MFDTDYPLTGAQIDFYRYHGFVQLNDVVTGSELDRMRSAVTGAVLQEVRDDRRAFSEKSTYEKVFIQRINLWRRHAHLQEFILARRFGNIAARLSGYSVRIFHDHALYKEPFKGERTVWHQDTHYWPHQQKGNQLSLWLALTDATPKSGCLSFIPGTQKLDNIPVVDLTAGRELKEVAPALMGRKGVCVPRAGSCTFHNGLTFHYAGPNRSERMREALAIIYMPDGTTYSGTPHVLDYPGVGAGDVLNDERFPIVSDAAGLKTLRKEEFAASNA